MTLLDKGEVEQMIACLRVIRKNGGTVYLFGNGGSHATASHFANDLIKMCRTRAVCIGDMASAMLAYGNDNGWLFMFSHPLQKMLRKGDGVIGISCSGDSENVLNALDSAVGNSFISIGLTGNSELSRINKLDLHALVHARYPDIRVQEDLHMMVCHAVARSLQELD